MEDGSCLHGRLLGLITGAVLSGKGRHVCRAGTFSLYFGLVCGFQADELDTKYYYRPK